MIAYETELISHFNLNSANSKKLTGSSGLGKDQRNFVFNLTNTDLPEFYIQNLKSGVTYLLLIYAVNAKGSSPFATLIGQTVAMLRQTIPNGKPNSLLLFHATLTHFLNFKFFLENEQIIKIDAYVVIGGCIFFTIFIFILIIMLIIRIRNKAEESKKQNNSNLDQLNNEQNSNGCDELNKTPNSKSSKRKRGDTSVKKTFNKNELINDKLFDSEKFTENHFHSHHHFRHEQFIDPSNQDM